MSETVLFSFPAVGLALTGSGDDTPAPGFLVLTSSSQPTEFDPSRYDVYLRLQHTPEGPATSQTSHPIDVLIEAWRELRKISPTTFILATSFGELTLEFPDLHTLIPQSDARVDVPAEVKSLMTWEGIVREFENEIDRFVSYRKNSYSLVEGAGKQGYDFPPEKGGVAGEKAKEAGYAAAAPAYAGEASTAQYNPATYSDEKKTGRVVLIDEENGNEVGEMGGLTVQTQGIMPGSKDPVEITLPQYEGDSVMVRPADYLRDALDPAYQNSSLVQTAATASRLLVTTSGYISNAMLQGSRTFSEKVKPNATPMTFQPSTHTRMQQLHNFSAGAAKFSSATIGRVGQLAQNAGAKLAGKGERTRSGKPANPGILNKSLIAFGTIADGIDYASKSLMASTSTATASMVGHKYGPEAGDIARTVTGSIKNVGLVYIDAAGVSRRAVVKGVAKGMVVGKVKGGGEVIVPGNNGAIEGIPAGWGDGPMGGPHPGPPSRVQTPVHSATPPPGYGSAQSGYFPPPPQSEHGGSAMGSSVQAQPTGNTTMSGARSNKEKESGGWRF
ncbi:senescence-associated protein-domain-containing protein [Geopyxis carbonaria]|nr:senescence-associated protein-domain-containing protein [Geopyxis carbonaria]